MATGAKMTYNHYQAGKYGTIPQNPGKDMEITQDMHLKMSKKIAQLTKVIYALNTKNDEHEAIIASIKEQHEEQIQQLLNETKAKVEQYRQRLGTEDGQQRRLEKMEVMLEDSQRHKRTALAEFEEYKRQQDEQDLQLKTEHSQKVLAMSYEVLTAKKEFQARLQVLDTLKEKLEQEKREALEAQREQHQQELEALASSLQSTSDLSAEQQRLQEQYKAEIEKLTQNCQDLTDEQKKLSEEHEAKMSKAQAFFEKEMQALRDSQNSSSNETLQQLQEEHQKLIKDFAYEKSVLNKKVEGLIDQVSEREEEVFTYRDKLQQLESNLQNNNSSVVELNKQIADAKAETAQALTKLKDVETDLSASNQRCEQQAKELMKKSTQLGELEGAKIQYEKKVEELQGQLSKAQDRIKLLESAKRALESQSTEQSKQQIDEIQALETAMADLSTEKQKQMEEYERRLRTEADAGSKREKQLEAEHEAALDALRRKHETEAEMMRRDLEEKLRRMKEELAVQLDAEMSRVMTEKQAAEHEYDQNRATLLDRLARAEDEVSRLTSQVQDGKKGLGSATSELDSLRDQAQRLKSDLEATRADLRTTKNRATTLQTDYDALKAKHEQKTREAEEDAKRRLEQLTADLDRKWNETLRTQSEQLAEQITAQKEEDKRAALAQLTKMKDAEIDSQRYTAQQKINDLKKQLAALQSSADELKKAQTNEMEQLKSEADAENKKLREDLLAEAEEYAKKIEAMEGIYSKRIKDMEDQREKEATALEEQLKARHLEDMQVQLTAHRATLDSARQTAQQTLDTEIKQQSAQHKEAIDSMKTEMSQLHAAELDIANRAHQQQLAAARMELERAIDITKQKEAEFQMKVSELEEDIRFREQTIRTLEEEMKALQSGVTNMAQELEAKGKEVLRVRSDARKAMKAREEQLVASNKAVLSDLSAEYLKEKQGMLAEFTEAQELLKDKISAMVLMLEEAEERYRNRESREEDLQLIQQLQEAIQDREYQLKKLHDEKRKFQMELVNRETNFNKMFNANPQVGVLNPFGGSKSKAKKGDKSIAKYSGSNGSLNSVGSTRLDPLPNSPLHDERLNQTRPLPPTKKFIR